MTFSQSSSFKKLQALSAHPIDLTVALTPERVEKMVLRAEGFDLLYATERVSSEVIEALYTLADEMHALQKMRSMQEGVKINCIKGCASEDRAVLHTAMRDQFSNQQTAPAAAMAACKAGEQLSRLQTFLTTIEGQFTDLVQIGIGGSDLGPRALCVALRPFYKPGVRVHFISNVDPDDANSVLNQVDLKKTLVVSISKSGTTLETLTNEEFVRSRFKSMGLNPKDHFVAVTGERSPMDDPSRYFTSFHIWDFVGGRYSATSMVGGVVLGFCLGFHGFLDLLKGAHVMDYHALTAKSQANLPLLSALLGIWNRNFLHLPTVAVIPYSQALWCFPAHLQQLDMESNGKRIDRLGHLCAMPTGPVIWGGVGTNCQHSFCQLLHQGMDVVPIEFIGFRKSQYPADLILEKTSSQEKLLANLLAQAAALALGQKNQNPNKQFPGNRPSRILMAQRLDPFTLGALLSFYEHKVAFQGFIWDINSFDQEGVQLGKLLAQQVLSLLSARSEHAKSELFPLSEAFLRTLSI